MPIYEYRCDACGHTVEVFQKFSDDPLETCEVCGGHLAKVLHPVAIHFKGSGFYTTDYGRGSGKARSAGEAAKAADEADKKADQAKGAEAPAAKATGDGAAQEELTEPEAAATAAASSTSTNHKTG